MSKKHSKKRNAGLLFEFLIRHISTCIVEGREEDSKKAITLLKRHFKPGSELYREYRLFNALVKTTVSSQPVAFSILSEAKTAVRSFDRKKLEHEKSMLIRGINHTLSDKLYESHVSNYRTYATIGTLFSDWREGPGHNIERVAEYEAKLVEMLTTHRENATVIEEMKDESVDRLVVKLMTEKVNKKYSGKLNSEQQDIVKSYVFGGENNADLVNVLESIRETTLSALDRYVGMNPSEKQTIEVLTSIKENVLMKPVVELTDAIVETYMKVSQLKEELLRD